MKNEAVKEQAKFILYDQLQPVPREPRAWNVWDSTISVVCICGINRILLRKEVIQPQVPLRLPCYDFVPVTSLTLGHRLPCGLANILRAEPASMT